MAEKLKKRAEVDPSFKWRVNDLFADDAAWNHQLKQIQDKIKEFSAYKANFTTSAAKLLQCLNERSELSQAAERVYVYATMKMHEDNGDSQYQGMADQAENLVVRLSSAMSFIEPALLALDEDTLAEYVRAEPGLALYKHYFDNLLRQKDHILSPELEELLADAQEIASAPDTIFTMINDADIKFGTVKDESGNELELTHGRYGSLMESTNRAVRESAFKALYDAFMKQKNTLAATYSASVKADVFFGRTRKYKSAMEAALSHDNIPTEVYTNLIQAVHENLPSMYKYMQLRKRALKLDELHMYDVYAPIVDSVNTQCTFEDAKATVLKALSVLGEDYAATLKEAFASGWIDVYENEGKHSGAYSWGAYGCHPYVLLNFDNKINDMFTLAHEMGHAMHSHYTWSTQPYLYGDYTIFLAEIASTVNESLLMAYLRKTEKDSRMQAYLVNFFLEQFRTTLFRQTMFAEFEMLAHQMAESGKPLTVDSLNSLYLGLNEQYFGSDVVSDPQIAYEWSRIPHFYNAFYVFQYATGFSAAVAFSKHIMEQGAPAVDKYKGFLKSGSSDYSINILKKAGVDMSSPVPVREALQLFGQLVDEMEGLI